MPLAAGASALALGLAQNHLNPLQREQTPASQWVTNGVSIGISLFLGAFVPLGVGVYWIASNLLTIAQQALLNRLVSPEKYVCYAALTASKKELAGMNSLSAGTTKEDRAREKADYKRFFSIANKHLVFYSEKSGFYKYFEAIIEYLLAHSNVTIHYVTSDPMDQIFEIAKREPKIRPYYIGEKRLITLFMKMDADIVVMTMPDLENFHLKRSYVKKDIEYIYTWHGMTSLHLVLRNHALDHYDTVFCVGQHQMDEIRRSETVYHTKEKRLIPCGYSLLERQIEQYEHFTQQRRADDRTTVLIAPSWQEDNIMDSCIGQLMDTLVEKHRVIVRPHPEYIKRYPQKIEELKKVCQKYEKSLEIETDFSGNTSLYSADVLLTDWSTVAYEYAFVTLKPCLFINTPMKVKNPEWKQLGIVPTDISLRDVIGISVDLKDVERIEEPIGRLLKEKEKYREKILKARNDHIFYLSDCGKRAGDYILGSLAAKKRRDRSE